MICKGEGIVEGLSEKDSEKSGLEKGEIDIYIYSSYPQIQRDYCIKNVISQHVFIATAAVLVILKHKHKIVQYPAVSEPVGLYQNLQYSVCEPEVDFKIKQDYVPVLELTDLATLFEDDVIASSAASLQFYIQTILSLIFFLYQNIVGRSQRRNNTGDSARSYPSINTLFSENNLTSKLRNMQPLSYPRNRPFSKLDSAMQKRQFNSKFSQWLLWTNLNTNEKGRPC